MFVRLPLLATIFHCAILHGWAQEISIEKAGGPARFVIESEAVTDLSGLTWTRGDAFYAVADHPNMLVPLTLRIDPATGSITRGEIGTPLSIRTPASDFEGITYVGATETFYISAEHGNVVVALPKGGAAQLRRVPRIFSEARKNLGLESITWNDDDEHFWVTNEEALEPDGPLSGATGTLVRLQQLDANFRPLAQYAWRTEPAGFRFRNSGNGVADLCLLPDGRLLVLERGFAFGGLRLRLFLADFKDATDISRLPALANADFTPARKILLYEEATGFINFEGLALGPVLADGSRSLIAIADSNSSKVHTFLPLRLRIGAPATAHNPAEKAAGR